MDQPTLDVTLAYHQRSKHFPFRFAPSLGYMDWQTQPDPFRRFEGAQTFPLGFEPVRPLPRYEPAFVLGQVDPAPLNAATVARLFYDALALSAWKEIAGARWSLRVNPSSGNLHPTEGYLVGGLLPGLYDKPAVYHYAPLVHALELRVELSPQVWRAISAQLPKNALRSSMKPSFLWRRGHGCPSSLPLFFLAGGDVRRAAQQTSCDQAIAAAGGSSPNISNEKGASGPVFCYVCGSGGPLSAILGVRDPGMSMWKGGGNMRKSEVSEKNITTSKTPTLFLPGKIHLLHGNDRRYENHE